MTYWETFRKIENDLDMTSCGIAQFTLNLWIDNLFKASGTLQDQEIQNILKATATDVTVKHYRVWENEIFLIAETRKGRHNAKGYQIFSVHMGIITGRHGHNGSCI